MKNLLSILLSSTALTCALLALAVTLLYDPTQPNLKAYNLTTPEDALKSNLEMNANADFTSLLYLQGIEHGRRAAESLQSLRIHKTVEYQGQKVLFISYQENGLPKFDTPAFEKDAESGLWIPQGTATLSYFKKDEDLTPLEASIKSWRAQGEKN